MTRLVLSAGLTCVALIVSGCGGGANGGGGATVVKGPAQETFAAKCGGCHTLAAAGTHGSAGPNLDDLKPDKVRVLNALMHGGTGGGVMPKNLVTGARADEVAGFVANSAGK
ncbi:MAG: cytochrome c [Thermoleophilia bacterium]|nr:cytochrome c [Thermoleophilia bacterium]